MRMNNIRAFIVDDSELDRLALRTLLKHLAGTELVGEADSVAAALEPIHRLRPDLLLLDLQLRGETSLDLVHALRYKPGILFVTGLLAPAVETMGLKVEQCVFKPVSLPKLAEALDRTRRQIGAGGDTGALSTPV
jgi:two-component SAPR family response regulator